MYNEMLIIVLPAISVGYILQKFRIISASTALHGGRVVWHDAFYYHFHLTMWSVFE